MLRKSILQRPWNTPTPYWNKEEVLVTPRHHHLHPRHSAGGSSSTKPLAKTCFCKHASQNMKLKHSGPYEKHIPVCISKVSDFSSRLHNAQHVKRTPQASRPIPARSPQSWKRRRLFWMLLQLTQYSPDSSPKSCFHERRKHVNFANPRDSITILRRI